MRAVVAVYGENVSVAVSVVKSVGDLRADVNVGGSQSRLLVRSDGVTDKAFNIGKCHAECVRSEILGGKRGVIVVKTRVKNCDNRSRTVISTADAVEDTRVLNVDGVFNKLVLHRLVNVADDNVCLVAESFANALKIAGGDEELKARQNGIVIKSELVGVSRLIELFDELCVLLCDILAQSGSLVTLCKFGDAHRLIGGFVCIKQTFRIDLDDERDDLVILDRVRKSHDSIRKILRDIVIQLAVKEPDVGFCGNVSRSFDANSDDHRCQQEHGKHR